MGIRTMAVWQVDCTALDLHSQDATAPAYWAERWELYRLFYVGGRFMARYGVRDVEIYNEPDLAPCMTPAKWRDHYRIRSMAVQHAYADFSDREGGPLVRPNMVGPPTAASRWEEALDGVAVGGVHELFPSGTNTSWYNMKAFSYHYYSAAGGAQARGALDALSAAVAAKTAAVRRAARGGGGRSSAPGSMPMYLTECNCYTSRAAEARQEDIMDQASTGACIADLVAATMSGLSYLSLFKFTQTFTKLTNTRVVRNGV
jgi:hypothetical protein